MERAKERGVVFRGAKKSKGEDQCFAGSEFIVDVEENEDAASSEYQLVAGTAFLFARPEFDGTLDYLFIDEAGQVCLANVVAMGARMLTAPAALAIVDRFLNTAFSGGRHQVRVNKISELEKEEARVASS